MNGFAAPDRLPAPGVAGPMFPEISSFLDGQLLLRAAMFAGTVLAAVLLSGPARAETLKPVLIGLDAAMSGPVGQSGESIRRGLLIAIDEINAAGGVLGRKLDLVVRDHRGVPARGVDNIRELAKIENLVAVVGGLHSPVALAELEPLHERGLIYLGPWAAATAVVDNGYRPNYVFRVSARDQYAGAFLINEAIKRGYKTPGLLLWRTAWGRSNKAAMTAAIADAGIRLAGTRWFNTSDTDMSKQIDELKRGGADVIMLVANAAEGLSVLRRIAEMPPEERLPVVAHWGMSGGNVFSQDPEVFGKVDYSFLQTYSFFNPWHPERANKFRDAYCTKFKGCGSPASIVSPVGGAHAYDLVHLLALAIKKAGTTERARVRDAMESLGRHEGLVRDYDPPFTEGRHDALTADDFRLMRYGARGAIVPIGEAAIQ